MGVLDCDVFAASGLTAKTLSRSKRDDAIFISFGIGEPAGRHSSMPSKIAVGIWDFGLIPEVGVSEVFVGKPRIKL
jgi:hypothetical protein